MEGAVKKFLSDGVIPLQGKQLSRFFNRTPSLRQMTTSTTGPTCSMVYLELPPMVGHNKHLIRTHAIRRRISHFQSDSYVLMEPGKGEEFVSEEELKARLKDWLQKWPGVLPPDLAKFKTIDDAVYHLVKSVCELEVDGEVGSIQWYQVRLE